MRQWLLLFVFCLGSTGMTGLAGPDKSLGCGDSWAKVNGSTGTGASLSDTPHPKFSVEAIVNKLLSSDDDQFFDGIGNFIFLSPSEQLEASKQTLDKLPVWGQLSVILLLSQLSD